MAKKTKIQWCDGTVNPVMGCGGCELFRSSKEILAELDRVLAAFGRWLPGKSRKIFRALINRAMNTIPKAERHLFSRAMITTNLYHLRAEFTNRTLTDLGREAAKRAMAVIEGGVKCYAARLHLNKARSIVNPDREANTGYAPNFERLTRFHGRVAKAARTQDLCGTARVDKPWLEGLPRLIFLSDMGDALSRDCDLAFLEEDTIPAIASTKGMRHLWLWLSKRPERMAEFATRLGGLPSNVCAMTTVTSPQTLSRVDQLRRIKAHVRGLSIEPVLEEFEPGDLNLAGIDWVILGGESGALKNVSAFDLGWARRVIAHCRAQGVAVFVKQLGRKPVLDGEILKLKDNHGGNWAEWPKDLRVRELPRYFHDYRRGTVALAA